jgi:hypothetical protein
LSEAIRRSIIKSRIAASEAIETVPESRKQNQKQYQRGASAERNPAADAMKFGQRAACAAAAADRHALAGVNVIAIPFIQ